MQEVSCSLNFDSHTGRGKVSLANPRYSGLRGDNLSGGFRWERDVVRLEKLVVQQQRSRCGFAVLPCACVGIVIVAPSAAIVVRHSPLLCATRKLGLVAVAPTPPPPLQIRGAGRVHHTAHHTSAQLGSRPGAARPAK